MRKLAVTRSAFVALVASILCLPATGRVHAVAPGEVDLTFDAGNIEGFFSNAELFSVVVQPDGKILVAGLGLNVGGIPYKIARLNPDGSLDPTFTLLEMAGGIQACGYCPSAAS